jgi:hypothetical protein
LKGDKWIRLSAEALAVVKDFQALHRVKTQKEALSLFVLEAARTREYLQYFISHRQAQDEDPACLRRIGPFMGSFFCAVHAPKVVELKLGLDICRACKSKVILKTYPNLEEPPLVSTANRESQETAEPKYAPVSRICPKGLGLVYSSGCAVCKQHECAYNPKVARAPRSNTRTKEVIK